MALQIVNSRGFNNKTFNLMVFGDPGVGKTRFAATAQNSETTSPVLLCDVEGGSLTLHDMDVDLVRIRKPEELSEVHTLLGKGHYKTVIIDSLSELYSVIHKDILKKKGIDQPTQQTWGMANEAILTIVKNFRDVNINFIATSWAKTDKDESTGRVTISNDLPGQSERKVAGQFDLVGYLTIEKEAKTGAIIRALRVQPDTKIQTKDRYGLLPPVLYNPSVPQILETLIKNSNSEKGK